MLHRRLNATSINDAFDAVWNADYDRAAALLHNADGLGCAAMRARVYMRLGYPERAVQEYRLAQENGADIHPRELAELAMVAGGALRQLGDRAASEQATAEAETLGRELSDPLFEVQRAYAVAFNDFANARLKVSEQRAHDALVLADRYADFEAPLAFLFEANHTRARILDLLGLHAALRCDYVEQERLLVDAIRVAERVRHRDAFIEANLLANLSTLIVSFPCLRSRQLVLERASAMTWTDHTDLKRVYVKRGLRCNKDIFGFKADIDAVGGKGYPSLAWRMADTVDRLTYDHWRDPEEFERERAFASELAQGVDWQATEHEEVTGLLQFCAIAAPVQVELAEHMLEKYRRKLPTLARNYAFNHDPRRVALEDFVEGAIAKARGNAAASVRYFEKAVRFWRSRAMTVRAAGAGVERFAVTHDPDDLEDARAFMREHPKSHYTDRLRASLARAESAGPGDFPYLAVGAPRSAGTSAGHP